MLRRLTLEGVARGYLRLLIVAAIAVAVFGVYAALARWALHGPVTAASLHESISRTSGSASALLDGAGLGCRRASAPQMWTCDVYDSDGSGGVTYRVRVERDSSCWRARLTRNYGEGGLPSAMTGCVHRWQWSLL